MLSGIFWHQGGADAGFVNNDDSRYGIDNPVVPCTLASIRARLNASGSTLRRYLRYQGLDRRRMPKRASAEAEEARMRHGRLEIRSYETSHVNGLWRLRMSTLVRRKTGSST